MGTFECKKVEDRRSLMFRFSMIAAALSLFIAGPAFAQEWVEYSSRGDFFSINFPTEPKVESITYTTEFGIKLPGHVYRSEEGPSRYSVTVVDYTDDGKIQEQRSKECLAS